MTSATRFIVVFAAKSKILRRKIFVDDDSQIDAHQPGPGETRLLLPLSAPSDDAACRAAIAAVAEVKPPSGRCCIIDENGRVVGICNADPALDTHPAGRLVAHDLAGLGDRYRDGTFMFTYAIPEERSRKVSLPELLRPDEPVAVQTDSNDTPEPCDNDDTDCPKASVVAQT
jgi:hypothetical protein